ncbi:hypothetical protein Mal64_06180 [Pseudobythopirellula maris]|uniref:Glycosyltransferase RgtA/B/C/D-like domain-containing protein n=1 Tax=Pseudobythopirellula maris TaxID=2527991 RepID=A0A5C5ZRU9_9BACT|nr:glycosyltransferase family 39 protein [Pseudobythopirellula maris]TWT90234.1 hypothetical protein Mal64_06180 [Pseudobythopirellula maris]
MPAAHSLTKRAERWWVFGILLVSLLFHALTIRGQGLFVDEMAELLHARAPAGELLWLADSSPPLYSLMLQGWVALFGKGEQARWLSVTFSLTTIVVVWRWGRMLGGPALGVAAAAAVALCPLQLFYAQFIRSYALLTLLAAGAACAATRAIDTDRPRDWALFAVIGALGVYAHYYFVVTLLVLGLALIVQRGWRMGRRPVAAALAIAVLAAPAAPMLLSDFSYQKELRASRPMSAAAVAFTGFSWFSGYSLGPSKNELQVISGGQAARQAAPWGLAILLCTAPLLWRGARRLRREKRLATIALLVVAPTLIVGLLGAASGITYNPRFVAWCVAPLSVWLAAGMVGGVSGETKWPARLATLGLAAIAFVAVSNRHSVDRYAFEDLRGVSAWLDENAEAGEPVFVVSDYLTYLVTFYDGSQSLDLHEFPTPGERDVAVRSEQEAGQALRVASRLSRGGALWLVYSRPFHGDPEGLLLAAMKRDAGAELAVRLPGVDIYRGAVRAE